jgi:hypothetical protein
MDSNHDSAHPSHSPREQRHFPEPKTEADHSGLLPVSDEFMRSPGLSRSVNEPLRAQAMQGVQNRAGNRAAQRFVQRTRDTGAPRVSVQRGLFDWLKKKKPAPDSTPTPDPTPTDPMKAFEDLSSGSVKYGELPKNLKLPTELTTGLQKAWEGSLPGGEAQEQGGLLVKDKGKYAWKPGAAGESGSFTPNYGDVGSGETLMNVSHTHPYSEAEGGHTNVSFSGADLASFVTSPEKFQSVQSGKGQFATATTPEFEKRLKGLDAKGKKKLYKEIDSSWDKAYAKYGKKKDVAESADLATRDITKKYKLAYYVGEGGDLVRQ